MRQYLALALLAAAAATTGCAMNSIPATLASVITNPAKIAGKVHGGQQPVANARVYLLAAAAMPGQPSVDTLLTGQGADSTGYYVLTDTGGNFSLNGIYTCLPGSQVYVFVQGGNPGIADGTDNQALTMASTLGSCPASGNFAGTVPYISVNELTTVAAAYALAPFATDGRHVSYNPAPVPYAGIANAFNTAITLVSPYDGTVSSKTPEVPGYAATAGLSANGTVPYKKINTLANIIAACINSDGTSPSCTQLFSNSTRNGVPPADTFTALLNIASQPGLKVAALYNLNAPMAPFQPTLTTTPSDWTLAIAYTAPQTPGRIAIDAAGDVWFVSSATNTLTELDPQGTVLTGISGVTGGGLNAPTAIAIGPNLGPLFGNLYVANSGAGSFSTFANDGTPLSPAAASLPGASRVNNISFNANGQPLFATNTGVMQWNLLAYSTSLPIAGGATNAATDINNNPWVADSLTSSLATLRLGTPTSYTGGGLLAPTAIATDSNGFVWATNSSANSLSLFNTSGTAMSSSAFTGGGLNAPTAIVIDGNGNAWISNSNGTLSNFNPAGTALSGSAGYKATTTAFLNLAPDASGSLWAPNANGKLYKFIGLAAPTATPLTNITGGTAIY